MLSIQFLTTKKISPNTHSIIYPILRWNRIIKSKVGETRISQSEIKHNSDIIIIDSKYHKNWWLDKDLGERAVMKDIDEIKKKCNKIVYYDTTDSSGCIQKEVFKKIDQYWKGQTLLDKNLYKKNFFNERIFTDYIKKKYFTNELNDKSQKRPLSSDEICKIKTAWNSSLTNYSFFGGRFARLASRYKVKFLLNKNILINSQSKFRQNKISCRIFSEYNNPTISWQRERSRNLLSKICDTQLISKGRYHKELKNSKMTFSPFGWGEICYRDFEAYFSGSLLIKPSMEHIETWPNLYIKNHTYIPCRWDLEDLVDLINKYENDYYLQIPQNAKNVYSHFLNNGSGESEFSNRFKNLIDNLIEI